MNTSQKKYTFIENHEFFAIISTTYHDTNESRHKRITQFSYKKIEIIIINKSFHLLIIITNLQDVFLKNVCVVYNYGVF